MAAFFYVSSLPQPPAPPGGDKPWHLLAYLGLGVVVVRAVAGGLPARIDARTAAVAIAITAGYGVTDELHQMIVPGRSAQVGDLVADAIGACIAIGVCWVWGLVRGAPSAEDKAQVTKAETTKTTSAPRGS